MKIVEPSAKIIDEIDGMEILKKIENAARTCYQSMDKAGEGTAERLISSCIQRGHESILEHVSVSVRFITDRAIHNELVRHRLIAVSCESSRYCRYENGIEVIGPQFVIDAQKEEDKECVHIVRPDGLTYPGLINIRLVLYDWVKAIKKCEESYLNLLNCGCSPQDARSVLPLSLKTEYFVTANLREWRHIFQLRCAPDAHPEMRRVMIPLLREFQEKIPVIFDDSNFAQL